MALFPSEDDIVEFGKSVGHGFMYFLGIMFAGFIAMSLATCVYQMSDHYKRNRLEQLRAETKKLERELGGR